MHSGIVIINKPTGVTSRFIVDKVGKYYQTKKVGHTGTLDPLATGVLVICVNQATKLVDFLTSTDKEYVVTMQLGILTDTLDITGSVLSTVDVGVAEDVIIKTIMSYVKTYEQEVPIYSAVKVNGKKCYEYARNGEVVELPKKMVTIKSINDIAIKDNLITFTCLVSKGTYIRSLIRDIGNDLGTGATMTDLVRTKQGSFNIKDANNADGPYQFIAIDTIFKGYPKIIMSDEEIIKVKNGVIIDNNHYEYLNIYNQSNELIAIYQVYTKDPSKLKPLIIINNA